MMVMNISKDVIIYLPGTLWLSLGIIRGINQYNYEYSSDKPYFYTKNLYNGIAGLLLYTIPVMLPFVLYKEMYRLEVNIRGIQKSEEYYRLL
jgi:hypothetical protein